MFRFVLYFSVVMMLINHLQAFTTRLLLSSLLSMLIAKLGFDKKSLSPSGAWLAIFVGFFTSLPNYAFLVCLLTFFLTASYVTKLRSGRKRILEENYREGGQRNAKQVMCNGGVAVFISIIYLIEVGCTERPINFSKDFTSSVLITSLIGSLACCNGDTWSSEIGTVMARGEPRLITTGHLVPTGTNGGVSTVGLISSACGGFAIGVAFLIVNMCFVYPNVAIDYPAQWPVLVLSVYAGLFGSMLDSLIGATCQYSAYCSLRKKVVSKATSSSKHICGTDILDNDQVNLMSSILMALTTPVFAYYMWKLV